MNDRGNKFLPSLELMEATCLFVKHKQRLVRPLQTAVKIAKARRLSPATSVYELAAEIKQHPHRYSSVSFSSDITSCSIYATANDNESDSAQEDISAEEIVFNKFVLNYILENLPLLATLAENFSVRSKRFESYLAHPAIIAFLQWRVQEDDDAVDGAKSALQNIIAQGNDASTVLFAFFYYVVVGHPYPAQPINNINNKKKPAYYSVDFSQAKDSLLTLGEVRFLELEQNTQEQRAIERAAEFKRCSNLESEPVDSDVEEDDDDSVNSAELQDAKSLPKSLEAMLNEDAFDSKAKGIFLYKKYFSCLDDATDLAGLLVARQFITQAMVDESALDQINKIFAQYNFNVLLRLLREADAILEQKENHFSLERIEIIFQVFVANKRKIKAVMDEDYEQKLCAHARICPAFFTTLTEFLQARDSTAQQAHQFHVHLVAFCVRYGDSANSFIEMIKNLFLPVKAAAAGDSLVVEVEEKAPMRQVAPDLSDNAFARDSRFSGTRPLLPLRRAAEPLPQEHAETVRTERASAPTTTAIKEDVLPPKGEKFTLNPALQAEITRLINHFTSGATCFLSVRMNYKAELIKRVRDQLDSLVGASINNHQEYVTHQVEIIDPADANKKMYLSLTQAINFHRICRWYNPCFFARSKNPVSAAPNQIATHRTTSITPFSAVYLRVS